MHVNEDNGIPRRARRLEALRLGWVLVIGLALFVAAWPTGAQDRAALVRVLREQDDFRVRVQAAFALGNTRDPVVRAPLERALRGDANAAVRAAAATGLGRLGQAAAIPALRRAERDSSSAVRSQARRSIELLEASSAPGSGAAPQPGRYPGVPLGPSIAVVPRETDVAWPRVRYVVVLGSVDNTSGYRHRPVEEKLRQEMMHNLRLVRGLAVFDQQTRLDAEASRQIERRRLPVLRFDGNLRAVERRARREDISVRCEVSMMILDEPERNLRGMLSGAATGSEQRRRDARAQEERLLDQALTAAVRSAMADAQSAIHRAARTP